MMETPKNVCFDDAVQTPPAHTWQLKHRCLDFQSGPAIMGIVNVTPDSFSDGGQFFSPESAVEHALRLEDAGADILDIGGESTRPYSQPVTEDDELRRVVPVLESLSQRVSIPISIDTSKSHVAQAAIDLGAEIVNDVTGLAGDPDMVQLVAQNQVGVCAMHMQGNPQNMQDNPDYRDVVAEVLQYLHQRDAWLLAQGVDASRICLDPGIGFGKTHEHNLLLLQRAERFLSLGRPILVGHSRKGFVGKLLQNGKLSRDCGTPDLSRRDAGTLGISLALALKGIHVLRVHDVARTRDAMVGLKACLEL